MAPSGEKKSEKKTREATKSIKKARGQIYFQQLKERSENGKSNERAPGRNRRERGYFVQRNETGARENGLPLEGRKGRKKYFEREGKGNHLLKMRGGITNHLQRSPNQKKTRREGGNCWLGTVAQEKKGSAVKSLSKKKKEGKGEGEGRKVTGTNLDDRHQMTAQTSKIMERFLAC